jgi:hypothetical protein
MPPTPARIDYHIEKHTISERSETPETIAQWQKVVATCRDGAISSEISRVLLALRTVDYVTSFELPFRLLVTRAPQAIDKLRDEHKVYCKPVTINGRKRGRVYSLSANINAIPNEFHYQRQGKVWRLSDGAITTSSYIDISRQTPDPRERLRLALTSGLLVTALDAMLFFGVQRAASDVMVLRKQGLDIKLTRAEVFDNQTQTRREVPAYFNTP